MRVQQLLKLVSKLQKGEICLHSLRDKIDTTTRGGELVFHVFGALAQFEAEVIRELTNAGLEAARVCGCKGCRPFKLDEKKAAMAQQSLKDPDATVTEVRKVLGISRSILYRYVPASRQPKS